MSVEVKARNLKDFNNALIYKIQCEDGFYYYGSTCNTLNKRLENHRLNARHQPERRVYKHINAIGWDNARIILEERYPCESNMDLVKREDYFIRQNKNDPLCLNSNCAFNTPEQTKEANYKSTKKWEEGHKEERKKYNTTFKEKNTDYMKSYYQTNKVAILAKSQAKRETAKQQAPCLIE